MRAVRALFTIYYSPFTIYQMRLPSFRRLVRDFFLSAVEVMVMLLAWGDVRGFLAHGARAGIVLVLVVVPFITCWSESERANRGLRPVSGQWRTLILLELGFLVSYLLVPLCDRRNVLVLPESDALRYAGLLVFTAGFALRVWAFVYLGRLFSVFLTIQEGHRLVTDNIYRHVRHPSYTGLLVRSVGLALVFRSLVGLIACCALLFFLTRRIRHEERVLKSEFGAKWEAYERRTRWRLLPGVY
jgi:protein-S-isoprenylcysteine O-methyltransferase Ste14